MLRILCLLLFFTVNFVAFAGAVKVLEPSVSFQAVHRLGVHIVASGTNGGIYQSIDNGEQWSKVVGPVGRAIRTST